MAAKGNTKMTPDEIQSRLEVLYRDRPDGWEAEANTLSEAYAEAAGLDEAPTLLSGLNEFQEADDRYTTPSTDDLGDTCPHCKRPYDGHAPTTTGAGDSQPTENHQELAVFCHWLAILAGECQGVADAPNFWRTCVLLAWLLGGKRETFRELAPRLELSKSGVAKLVDKIEANLLGIRRVLVNPVDT